MLTPHQALNSYFDGLVCEKRLKYPNQQMNCFVLVAAVLVMGQSS